MKIFELKISDDDDISGIQYLSIVKAPANEIMFEVFSDDKPHTCYAEYDFSDEAIKVIENFGVEFDTEMLKYARIKPVDLTLTTHGFAPQIDPNPRRFDIRSGDQEDGDVITRYIYGIDTGMGAPLIKTSREWCRKMIAAQRVFSRNDMFDLSQKLSSDADTFKLIPRAKMNSQVDFFQYKGGALCRHRWFQIEFDVPEDMTYNQALAMIPLKAPAAIGKGTNVGGAGRPFQAEAKIVPASQLNRRPAGFTKEESFSPIGFHFGLFIYPSRMAAFLAEPTAKKITKIEIEMCGGGFGCGGWVGIEVLPEYFEGTAKVVDSFAIRHSFVEVPDYIQENAQRAVDYSQENGWGDCGTDVGKRRANDLARSGQEHSLETLTRMYSYGARHKVDYESSKSIDEGCGYLMMLSWGFSPDTYDSVMKYLEGQIQKATEMNIQFSKDEYRQDITAVVFQPRQYIYRYDRETNQPYYVFMSQETIRTALMKLSRLKPKNLINIEHSDKVFSGNDVYSYENWLVGEDPLKDKSYEIFGREFATGTWITTIHFRNEELFDEFILSNKTAGISLEGLFEEIPFSFMDDDSSEDREMVEGVIELLLQVEDLQNRKKMVESVVADFAEEGVVYDYDDFINRLGVETFAEVGPRGGIRDSKKAPKSDTKNPDPKGEGSAKGDASGKRGAEVDAATEKTLQKKVDDFNEKDSNTKHGRATLGALKSVYQRGLGAYNTSRSPSVPSAKIWSLARVNAYLFLLKNGRPERKAYVQDNDLLPEKHPKAGKEDMSFDYPDGTCWEGYEPVGTKILNGREVPNCVPVKTSKVGMGLQGINGKVPHFDLEEEAEMIAKVIECEGSHKMEYGFVPCKTHAEAEVAWDAYTRVFLLETLINKIMK